MAARLAHGPPIGPSSRFALRHLNWVDKAIEAILGRLRATQVPDAARLRMTILAVRRRRPELAPGLAPDVAGELGFNRDGDCPKAPEIARNTGQRRTYGDRAVQPPAHFKTAAFKQWSKLTRREPHRITG